MSNHDITHCTGLDIQGNICPKLEECFRYEMHLDTINVKDRKYLTYFRLTDVNKCEVFLDAKKK